MIAALFVDPRGPYPKIEGVDCWPKERNAMLYAGPHPVVAHPPCHLWVNLAAVNFKRYGGEHNRPGNDGGMFEFALRAVRTYGGVLEHPAGSNAFRKFGIDVMPAYTRWVSVDHDLGGGDAYTCEVWQSAYGHKARKRTWLYFVGQHWPANPLWKREAGTHQCGWFDRIKPTLSKAEASRTPDAFAEYLVSLARSVT